MTATHMLDLQHVRTFVAVAATKNFRQAALELGYSQGSVSLHIKALEEELGARLFDRVQFTRKVDLTDIGHAVLEYAQRLLVLAEEVKSVACSNPRSCMESPRTKLQGRTTLRALTPKPLCESDAMEREKPTRAAEMSHLFPHAQYGPTPTLEEFSSSTSIKHVRKYRTAQPLSGGRKDQLHDWLKKNGPAAHGEIVERSGLPEGTISGYLNTKNDLFEKRNGKWHAR